MGNSPADEIFYQKQNTLLTSVLERAITSPTGISISSTDPHELRRNLSIMRKKLRDQGDHRFDNLRITNGPEGTSEVFLFQKD